MLDRDMNRREFIKLGTLAGTAILAGGALGSGCAHTDREPAPSPPARAKTIFGKTDFDVVIVGAGPGGCLAAYRLAQQGFSVGLFDRAPQEAIGKPIVIEAERDIFRTVGLPDPTGDLIPYRPERIRVFSPRDKDCILIDCRDYPLPVAIRLDRFTQGLLQDALHSGARIQSGYTALSPIRSGRRVTGVRFSTPSGGTAEISARLVIDATGFAAALVRQLPPELDMRFPDGSAHEVSADNRLHAIDRTAAEQAVAAGRHASDEVWNRLGKYGVYSTLFSYLSLEQGIAYILIGYKQDYERQTMPVATAVDQFRRQQGYYGKELTGGGGLIRIHHPLDQPVADGFLAIGEAACQVVPMHASGVSSALYAGHLAAQTATAALRAGDVSTAALWPYAAQYQRSRGRILAALDVTRLSLERFQVEDVTTLVESGIMHKDDIVGGLLIREPSIGPASIPARMGGLLRHPSYLPRIIAMGITAQKVARHYGHYPEHYDPQTMAEWRREKQQLFAPILKT